MKKTLLLLLAGLLFSGLAAAQTEIRGKVEDPSGQPLIGATVVVKGSNTYAVTNETGEFSLVSQKVLPNRLQVNFVGFKEHLVDVTSSSSGPLTIRLEEDLELAEILITARRRTEEVQKVPIAISVVGDQRLKSQVHSTSIE